MYVLTKPQGTIYCIHVHGEIYQFTKALNCRLNVNEAPINIPDAGTTSETVEIKVKRITLFHISM